jgi:leucyl-tRNA synthetase
MRQLVPADQTVLANEQVIGSKRARGSEIILRSTR